jgi:hypothetical protein
MASRWRWRFGATTGWRFTVEELQAPGTTSFCAAFQLSAAAHPDRPAFVTPDGSVTCTWGDYADRVRALAGGLASLGVRDGDCGVDAAVRRLRAIRDRVDHEGTWLARL